MLATTLQESLAHRVMEDFDPGTFLQHLTPTGWAVLLTVGAGTLWMLRGAGRSGGGRAPDWTEDHGSYTIQCWNTTDHWPNPLAVIVGLTVVGWLVYTLMGAPR
jgi:hypothetical protein